jgi:predicted acetyltransferase
MLQDTLQWLRQAKMPLSSLYAFRESWYRRLGYEVCGLRWRIQAPAYRLPEVRTELTIRRVSAQDWRQLQPVHDAFCRRYSGMNPRSELRWQRVLAPAGNQNTILVAGDPAEAYAVVRLTSDEAPKQGIAEVAWSSPRGYAALLTILKQIAINHDIVRWFEPADSPFLTSYLDADVTAELARPIMYRITDVEAALGMLQPSGEGSLTMEVLDDFLEENRGPFRVEWRDGKVSVSAAPDAEVVAPIGALTQAFLGQPSSIDLVEQGRISVRSGEALSRLQQLLPPCPVYCMEFF